MMLKKQLMALVLLITILWGCDSRTPLSVEEDSKNTSPVIIGMLATPDLVGCSDMSTVTCAATDVDGDILTYEWTADAGYIIGHGVTVMWIAPCDPGSCLIACIAYDQRGGYDSDTTEIVVSTGMIADR